uniref:Subtilisin-like protease SBT1.7 n=1 Tax=Kalanchoe fedtschenkoi TaxID=63787 RepID=A0A7N0RIE6_KALFE
MSRIKIAALMVLLIASSCCGCTDAAKDVKKTYIVHVDKLHMPASFDHHLQWYEASLKSVSESATVLYSYKNVIHGFSARITDEEAELLQKQEGVLSVVPELVYELHTTRTPEFLGLGEGGDSIPASGSVSDVIVGVLDTGVWPESPSFDDTGLGPVPSSWKGQCEVGKGFNSSSCNKKLIGARYFLKGYEASFGPIDETKESKSPRDDEGHGTHTATTAAGSAVPGANFFGFAPGTARGMAPSARVAAYKICWLGGCFGTDILAALDKAVADGVHVLSLSIGGGSSDYARDTIAIGAFAATEHGILVSCSAGNAGPSPGSLSNVAPWVTNVGAGTLDRDFPAYVTLGDGKNFSGVSLYNGKSLSDTKLLPLVFAGNASNSSSGNLCMRDSLIPEKVAGKIVFCERGMNARVEKGFVVKEAGGAGMILANTDLYGEELVADAQILPSATVGQKAGHAIKQYLFKDPNPTATIASGGTKLGIQPSPVVAAFSSRGPNTLTPQILKPDIIAPGVNILAGWTGAAGPTGLDADKRPVKFNIISGTSMSCPHVSGLAALVKAAHPDWSPGAIRSALMTTAYTAYKNGHIIEDIATGNPSTPFDIGAGHVDPVAALDPGLVYDTTVDDYIGFLCALNYSASEIKQIARKSYTCESEKTYRVEDLNYPSFAVPLETSSGAGGGKKEASTIKYARTLTNVGSSGTYKVSVTSPSASVKILVEPQSLTFSEAYEKKSYTVTFTASSQPSGTVSFGRLEWSDGKHTVSSPVAFSWT